MSNEPVRHPTPVFTYSQREISDLLNAAQGVLAAIYRQRKETVRMQETLKQAIDEKTLQMLTELDNVRSRIEAIQVNLVKLVPPSADPISNA